MTNKYLHMYYNPSLYLQQLLLIKKGYFTLFQLFSTVGHNTYTKKLIDYGWQMYKYTNMPEINMQNPREDFSFN